VFIGEGGNQDEEERYGEGKGGIGFDGAEGGIASPGGSLQCKFRSNWGKGEGGMTSQFLRKGEGFQRPVSAI